MRFSIGIVDELFGKRTTLQIPKPDGTSQPLRVTEKWLKKMQASGAIGPFVSGDDMIEVHHYDGMTGYALKLWKVGDDVDSDTVASFRDPATNALYVMTVYKGTESKSVIVKHDQWNEWRAQFEKM